jgi:hypothetical protein
MVDWLNQLKQGTLQESSTKKLIKIPDPLILTNGKDPQFDNWLLLIKQKLHANVDHFNMIELQMAYVISLIAGKAREHIIPHIYNELINKYLIIEDMFEHLKTIYSNPNRVVNT